MKALTVSFQLHDLLIANRMDLSAGLIIRLKATNAAHYKNMHGPELKGRVDSLLDTFTRSIIAKPSLFANYLKSIAMSRISEGIALHEIQVILQILEDMAWCLVIDHIPRDQQIRCLSLVTTTVGSAKDQLAQVYLEYLEKTERRAAHLQRRLEEMSKGTDSGPIDDEVLITKVRP